MKMLHLKPITKDNWIAAIKLKVAKDQNHFVATNAVSLAQLNFLENFYAHGIYEDETMVGFTLFGIDEEDHEFWIYRLMIDKNYQGKGYGKEAVNLIIKAIHTMKAPQHQLIHISYEPENIVAQQVYKNAGFYEIEGLISDGEQVARYDFAE
ncbi:GNAT family N-acetyltransferase [Solibacillus sp. MA9]|uniref:GNAT family N-acetyltransferase n=1 Tax=Solibacillus palustris TaxID=2908203 RepID=A0ABS9UEA7_9BACL|nr:GNAT family N-acetyltransferase [Solibacillus sp. MA9]MCH7322669.1 GNAT family N-acetyltransferase [Solibacillus sp. MA9]